MIERLLIANRGEIACRVARTAHRLGMETLGVFSEADRGALHTRVVDRAVCLGGATPAESYLRGDAVLDAARRLGADAVHPGYGFLSENAAFARQVEEAGIIWVGPTPEQIELLGDKVAAKAAAVGAGVPTTEAVVVDAGAMGDNVVASLPVPAMVKAAAGGGGRGMRIVADRSEFAAVVASASREAAAAFGDGTVFVEPLVSDGRHVEVQILGDTHGNVVHLGERDCSIQRRHQKVIEEAPSPGIDDAIRDALCEGAVRLAREVSYRGAGTVEYLVGTDGTIAFLEVNTRLQVEHPVTEAVWGVDLVEEQLVVAAGAPLRFTQDDLEPRGHAIEARLVAEDPSSGWMPSTGTLHAFGFPGSHDVDGAAPRVHGVRVDSGVAVGSEVGSDYDSLLAKVISYAPTRTGAAMALGRAMRAAELSGVRTNAELVSALCSEEDFLAGAATTSYLDDHPEVIAHSEPAGDDRLVQALAAAFALEDDNRRRDGLSGFAPSGWRNVATTGQRVTLVDGAVPDGHAADGGDGSGVGDDHGSSVHLEYRIRAATDRFGRGADPLGARAVEVLVGSPPRPDANGVLGDDTRRSCEVMLQSLGAAGGAGSPARWQVDLDGVTHTLDVVLDRGGATPAMRVSGPTGRTEWTVAARFVDRDDAEAGTGPVSPLPGSVVSVHVAPGDEVTDGDLLVVIEAMKMEHRIVARGDLTVAEVRVAEGDKVDAGDVLVTFAEPG